MNRGLWIGTRGLQRGLMLLSILLSFSASLGFASNGFAGPVQTPGGETIIGKWQGAIGTPKGQLRIVIEISSASDKLNANFCSIDQQSPAIPASRVTWDGSILKMAITAINGNYEGKMSADGNSIFGTLSGGGQPTSLNLARTTPETAWLIPEPPPPPRRMDANAIPEFEVATIKPSNPSRLDKGLTVRGSDVMTVNTTLGDLIEIAYGLHAKQIVGAPSWLESEKFDVTGRSDTPGQPNVDQIRTMMQKLLADRFQLKFHRDKKDLSVYALTVAKGGPKFSKSARDPNGLPGVSFRGPGNLAVTNAPMEVFANLLQVTVLDKPVVDRTGLSEKYDFILKWKPDLGQFLGLDGTPSPTPDPDAAPDLFTAIQQQLGLKLNATKSSAGVIVIDNVAKPSEN